MAPKKPATPPNNKSNSRPGSASSGGGSQPSPRGTPTRGAASTPTKAAAASPAPAKGGSTPKTDAKKADAKKQSAAPAPAPAAASKPAATPAKAGDNKQSAASIATPNSAAAPPPVPQVPATPPPVATSASKSGAASATAAATATATAAAAAGSDRKDEKQKNDKIDAVVSDFNRYMSDSPEMAIAVAAIQALTGVVSRSASNTMMELQIELKAAADRLTNVKKSSISLSSGCELFNRYVTRMSDDIPDFAACKARLIERGEWFTKVSNNSRLNIAKLVDRFIRDGKAMLIHGYSRVVNTVLLHAAREKKYFTVYVTEGRPDCAGYQAADELIKAGIPVTLVLDSAVGYIMEKVDFVLMGAEGVVENGGIINKIGTYQIAMIARALKKPFYVAAESYKFARLFPLTQSDLPETAADQSTLKSANQQPFPAKLAIANPSADYTPPAFITLLFTDLGILTPSAVSDELIKLYY